MASSNRAIPMTFNDLKGHIFKVIHLLQAFSTVSSVRRCAAVHKISLCGSGASFSTINWRLRNQFFTTFRRKLRNELTWTGRKPFCLIFNKKNRAVVVPEVTTPERCHCRDVCSDWLITLTHWSENGVVIIRSKPLGRIVDFLYGPNKRPSRVRLYLHQTWTDLDEIWHIVSQMLEEGLALADFGRDLHSSDSLTGSRNFLCPVNNARFRRFPVGQFYDISTQQRRSVSPRKLLEQNFYVYGGLPRSNVCERGDRLKNLALI